MADCGPAGLVTLLVLVLLVALSALAIAIVALIRPDGLDDDKESVTTTNNNGGGDSPNVDTPIIYPVMVQESLSASAEKQKTWTISIGNDYGAIEFVDTTGYVKGFGKDLIDAVCDAAGITCETMLNPYSSCWEGQGQPGQGLLSGNFDACAGWLTTVDRIQTFQFSQPFGKAESSKFFIRVSDTTFKATDITGKRIGFMRGWASDPACLARQSSVTGNTLSDSQIVMYTTTAELISGLRTRAVDAIFLGTITMESYVRSGDIVAASSPNFQCLVYGAAIMTRKDNNFVQHWNNGFQKLRSDGDFKALCDKANADYASHGYIDCVD